MTTDRTLTGRRYPRGKLAIYPNTAHSVMPVIFAVRFSWCYGVRVSKRAVRRRQARNRLVERQKRAKWGKLRQAMNDA